MSQRIVLKRILSSQTRRSLYPRYAHTITISHHDNLASSSYSYPSHQGQRRFKSFQATQPLYNEESKNDAAAAAAPAGEEEDKIPAWQNPLHHNDPKFQKIMLDDYGPDEEPSMVKLPPIDDGSGKIQADPVLYDLADEIVAMNMLEVKELVDRIADHFGLEDNDDDFMMGGDGGGGGGGAEEEEVVEKTAFDLKLTGFDAKSKIKVIKEVRAITGLGLKEAKEMVEGAPKTIKGDIKMEEAEELKAKLEAVGATVEIA